MNNSQSDRDRTEPVLPTAPVGQDVPSAASAEQAAQPVADNPVYDKRRTYTRKIAITAVFTALSYGLYLLGKFCKLPFIFPSFFDLQFSELPALIVGFMFGPVYGAAVIIFKCLLKMPLTTTSFVGEATDLLLGLILVVPASAIYSKRKNIKGALLGVVVGSICMVVAALFVNRFISIPYYLKLYFEGDEQRLVLVLKGLFPRITVATFYSYYLCLSVIPFNLLRCIIMCGLTFVIYKRLSRFLKNWVGYEDEAVKAQDRAKFWNAVAKKSLPKGVALWLSVGSLLIAIVVGLAIILPLLNH